MCRNSANPIASLIFLLATVGPAPSIAQAAAPPDVISMIALVDDATGALEGYVELSAPMEKQLPTRPRRAVGNDFWLEGLDEAETRLGLRLTGQTLLRVASYWGGDGRLLWPPSESFSQEWSVVPSNPEPEVFLLQSGYDDGRARIHWPRVRDTNFVARVVAAAPRYQVMAHPASIGEITNPRYVWLYCVVARPIAPVNAAIVETLWPRGLVGLGTTMEPEVRVHNFADTSLAVGLRVTIQRPGHAPETSFRQIGLIPTERSVAMRSDPITLDAVGAGRVSWELTGIHGEAWVDESEEDDGIDATFDVVSNPVFRPVSSKSFPGPVPTPGAAADFDSDGDADLLTMERAPKLLRNDREAGWKDITGDSPITLRRYPYGLRSADFVGDRHLDLLLVYFGEAPMLLRGDGTGRFVDATEESGLNAFQVDGNAAVGDLDGDSDPDIVLARHGQEVLLRNDAGQFTDATPASGFLDPGQTEKVTLEDLDHDGDLDILLANWNTTSSIILNQGDWQFRTMDGPFPPDNQRDAAAIDYDRDGILDLLFADNDTPAKLFRGLGGVRYAVVPPEVHGLPRAWSATTHDVDGDGWADLLLQDWKRAYLLQYEAGGFVDRSDLLADLTRHESGSLPTEETQWIDLDGDGDTDLCAQSVTFLNTTRGTVPPYAPWYEDPPYVPDEWIEPPPPQGAEKVLSAMPRPFSGEVRIVLRPVRSARVHLDVFDVTGRRVAQLVNRAGGPDPIEVLWDGRSGAGAAVPAGVYFLRLHDGGGATTLPLVRVR